MRAKEKGLKLRWPKSSERETKNSNATSQMSTFHKIKDEEMTGRMEDRGKEQD